MSEVSGKVGKWDLRWLKPPRGTSGVTRLGLADGRKLEVRWRRDADGLWIELPHGTFGFDIHAERDDDGRVVYALRQRFASGQWGGIAFVRAGEENVAADAGSARRGMRVRAQMPGKILRVMVKPGQTVEKNQPLLLMEAMKMENEIRASQSGKVSQVKVSEGQAVETGADLCVIDPA